MSGESKPIQPNQNAPPLSSLSNLGFLDLPRELPLRIFQWICEPKDISKLNLISKFIKSINQESILSSVRIADLFAKYHGVKFDPLKMYSYQDFINVYSHCDLIDRNCEIENLTGEEQLTLIRRKFTQQVVNVDPSQFAAKSKRNFDLNVFDIFHIKSTSDYFLLNFVKLRPTYQLEALLAISSSSRTTQKITRKFYDALSAPMQTELKWQIWNANGQSSHFDGIDYGPSFGERVIAMQINSPLAQSAIRNYLTKFGVVDNAETR